MSRPLHIAIDARMYGVAQRGIGRYLMKLIENLEVVDKENHYTLFLRKENWDEYQPKNQNFKKALWDAPWYGWREQFFFKKLLDIRYSILDIKDNTNIQYPISNIIYHFPHWNVPLLFRRPFVVTIHDLELFSSNRTRDASTRGRFMYYLKHLAFRAVFRHAVLAARAIIVPSNFVKEQLLDMFPQMRQKVKVIYEAPTISPDIRYLKLDINQSKQTPTSNIQYPISQRYALYVGSAYPHKNLERLLEAWQEVHKELPEYKLVLVGREDFFWKKLRLEIGNWKLEIAGSLVFYGEATDEALTMLYRHASLLVQPSLEEGFSLSPLEALAFDCPVAVSDIPVHREILKDAAFFFNPRDAYAIAQAIKQALADKQARSKMRAASAPTLGRYSWNAHASQTKQVYETCRP